jgi:pimeloyl-ACP methyl ester carboxylesterase
MEKAPVNGIELAYETFGEGEPLVLVMGIGMQMVMWDEQFCRGLAVRGFKVIRFDNRDVGQSTKLDHLGFQRPKELLKRRLLRRPVRAEYTLDDMAGDTAALIEHLGFSSAHVVGMSLGGMVAQCLALNHPEKVRSLTLVMTNPGEIWANFPKLRAVSALFGKPGKTPAGALERAISGFRAIGGSLHNTPRERVIRLAGQQFQRGIYPRGFARQFAAIMAAPSRLRRLRELRVPTLVVHGADDPLIPPLGGRLLAAAIPGAKLVLIRGMGHDMGPSVWRYVIERIAENSQRDVRLTGTRPALGALFQPPTSLG